MNRPRRQTRPGFTLVEASLALVIVGTGIVTAAHLLSVGTTTNVNSHRVTTGLNLAVGIREMAYGMALDDLLALDGQVLSPPLDGRGEEIPNVPGWAQHVSVVRVDPNNVEFAAGASSTSRLLRLTVEVRHQDKLITTEQWLVANTNP